MKKAPSDGGGPWKGRFRPPRFNKLSEGLVALAAVLLALNCTNTQRVALSMATNR